MHTVADDYPDQCYLTSRCRCRGYAKCQAKLAICKDRQAGEQAGRLADKQANRKALTFARRSLPSFDRGRTREAWRTKNTSTRQAMRSVRADTKEGT